MVRSAFEARDTLRATAVMRLPMRYASDRLLRLT